MLLYIPDLTVRGGLPEINPHVTWAFSYRDPAPGDYQGMVLWPALVYRKSII